MVNAIRISSSQWPCMVNFYNLLHLCSRFLYSVLTRTDRQTDRQMAGWGNRRLTISGLSFTLSWNCQCSRERIFHSQWWSSMVFLAWSFVESPTSGMFITVVLLANLGGVYNCVAYTVIKRRLQQQKSSSQGPKYVVRSDITSSTGFSSTSDSSVPTTASHSSVTNVEWQPIGNRKYKRLVAASHQPLVCSHICYGANVLAVKIIRQKTSWLLIDFVANWNPPWAWSVSILWAKDFSDYWEPQSRDPAWPTYVTTYIL